MSGMIKSVFKLIDIRSFLSSEKIKPTVILMSAALFPFLHRYFGSHEFALKIFPDISDEGSALYMFIAAFVLFGLIPWAILKFWFKESLKKYGFRLGDWRTGLRVVFFLFVVISAFILLPSSQGEELRSVYPLVKSTGDSVFQFIRLHFLRGLLFYTAWEFFFRGYLLFGLKEEFGDWFAICIQTIPSCLWHIGLPFGEIMGSFIGGFLFGILAVKKRSFFWPFLLHYSIGIMVDVFIIVT